MSELMRQNTACAVPSGIRPRHADELKRARAAQVSTTFGQELFSIPWGHIRLPIDSFVATLPAPQGDLAQEITKDPYNFVFPAIRERYDERDLKDALMDKITRFLLELGIGFVFVGREYRVQIGQNERWIDMLFYHIRLRCYVVLEVKVTSFDPAFMGQLGTYVVAVNHQIKTEDDNPTIGLLVCKSLDKVEASFALESTSQPIGVSGYELSKLIPEDYKGSLPTIEEIEAELGGGQ